MNTTRTGTTHHAADDGRRDLDGPTAAEPVRSRRGLLRLAGATAVGAAAAAAVGGTHHAAAATGNPLVIGASNSSSFNDRTNLNGPFMASADSSDSASPLVVDGKGGTIAGWDYCNDPATDRGGVFGAAGKLSGTAPSTANGVLGSVFGGGARGAGVYGVSSSVVAGASPGVRARSAAGPAVQMEAILAGRPTTGTWMVGALVPDTAGHLWYCTASGTPGSWIDLAAPIPSVVGFHALTPTRVYDSRVAVPSPGPIAAGQQRELSVKDGRSLETGAITVADLVPYGASAITANVTVVETVGAGFLAINPGGGTTVNAATVNWFASGQILNNGVNLSIRLVDRTVNVIAGGGSGSQTHFVIDVTGYFRDDTVPVDMP